MGWCCESGFFCVDGRSRYLYIVLGGYLRSFFFFFFYKEEFIKQKFYKKRTNKIIIKIK